MRFKLTFIILFLAFVNQVFAIDALPEKLEIGDYCKIRLENGDIVSGRVKEFVRNGDEEGIKLSTPIGVAPIYPSSIVEITMGDKYYRHYHRVYILPTAIPIEDNHFVGNWELLMFYAGAGISDFLSITAGRTVVPGALEYQNASLINVKGTIIRHDFEDDPTQLYLAVGANLAWVNSNNGIYHAYATATVKGERSTITASVFSKVGERDIYDIYYRAENFPTSFPDGAFGLALGLDTRFSQRSELHFIGELWNGNITQPSNTGVLLGLRMANTIVSMDFGISFFTAGAFVPFVSFAFTPF